MKHIKDVNEYVSTYLTEKEKNPNYTIEQWCIDYEHPPKYAEGIELTPIQWDKLYEEPAGLWQRLDVELG